jgi:hypothetical protein
MELFQLKEYIKESCAFLGIDINASSEENWHISIPGHLVDEFSGVSEYLLSFTKTNNPKHTYITFESFFTQRLAKLVADRNHGVGHSVKRYSISSKLIELKKQFPKCEIKLVNETEASTDMLYVWCKTTIVSQLTEEYLKGFKVDLESGIVEPLQEDVNLLIDQSNVHSINGLSKEKLEQAFSTVLQNASKDAERFVEQVAKQINIQLNTEIKRITEYYETLIAENQAAETSKGNDPKMEVELLAREREALIHQQRLKYSIEENDITIEPVAMLVVRNIVEQATANIESFAGKAQIIISGNAPLSLQCQVSKSNEGPYIITSEGLLVAEVHSFICKTCNKLLDDNQMSGCKVCADLICHSCQVVSSVSKKPLCYSHAVTCTTCLMECAEEEQHLCKQCNQFYCRNCTPGSICPLCMTIAPIRSITPVIQQVLSSLPKQFKSKKFDFAEKGNRLALLGKGLMFKDFYVIYDKKEKRIVEMQEFGFFNQKK